MKISAVGTLAIPEIRVLSVVRFPDERGYFTETFRAADIADLPGIGPLTIAQANESFSRAGTIRGLHLQWNEYQGKLVRCVSGNAIDLALDVRLGSPSFGQIVAHELVANPESLTADWVWVPPGFAHGLALMEHATVEYFCTSVWSPGNEAGISPFATDIDWSLCDADLARHVRRLLAADPIVSAKDREGFSLAQWHECPHAQHFTFDESAPFRCRDSSAT